MGTKNISLTEEAYGRLKAHKREGESFSDVVTRLTDDTDDKMKGFGAWAGTDLHEAVEEASREFDEAFEDRQDALF
jgi:predicted CopG family antitoxin